MAPESHLWRGWGRQDSGRLRKKEKWGTWKERNRNPPGLPNLPFSEKEKKNSGSREKQNFYEQTKWAIVVEQRQDLRNTFIIFDVIFFSKLKIFSNIYLPSTSILDGLMWIILYDAIEFDDSFQNDNVIFQSSKINPFYSWEWRWSFWCLVLSDQSDRRSGKLFHFFSILF